MADTNAPILDLYAPLNHKGAMSAGPGPKWKPPGWIPKEHLRRVIAYQILDAVCKNNARYYRTEADERVGLREYGDADALVEAILSALIGDSQVISVDNAEAYDPEFDPAGKEQRELERQIAAEIAAERQELLATWGEDEQVLIKIPQAERKAIKLGDASVYVLDWSPGKRRPKLRTYDPGFYFPVFDDWSDEFPTKVHFAWETEDPKNDNLRKVRRITYELKPIERIPEDERGLVKRFPEGVAVSQDGETGTMMLPWNDPERPATRLCYKSDAMWTIDVTKEKVNDFDESKATWNESEDGQEIRNLLLNIDFLPIIHVPNTEEDEEHFGASSLLRVAQLLDDLMKSDTDLVDTSANTGFPALAFEGGDGPPRNSDNKILGDWGPGAYIYNPNGKVHVLSVADALKPLSEFVENLLDRLAVNGRVPASAMGRVKKDSGQESGIHLALSWGPLRSMIDQMRLARRVKYQLLLKFVQRFFMLDGQIEAGAENILNAGVVFGSFLPTDVDSELERIIKLFNAKLLSRAAALSKINELGIEVDDIKSELRAIEKEDFEAAEALMMATGNEQAVSERLGVEAVAGPTTPPPVPEF